MPTSPGGDALEPEDHDPALVSALRGEAARGPLTFARFMEVALYHPKLGYYSRRPDRGTRQGDFLTAPELDPLFAATVARQLEEMWLALDRPSEFVLRDHGAGSAALGVGVLGALRDSGSGLFEALCYEPVEVSAERLGRIAERLAEAGFAARFAAGSALDRRFVGCAVANEFLDALPVHRVVVRDGVLLELFVEWRDGRFVDAPGEPSTPRLAEWFERVGVRLAEGQIAEVNLGALDWVAELAASLDRGFALIIDYGHPARELYGPNRMRGTLLGYRGHAVSDDPYASIGRQDLTAHVDFTALERTAEEHGLRVLGRTTQAEFLTGLGLGDLFAARGRAATSVEAYAAARSAVLRMLDPRHLGGFGVLVLAKGVDADVALRGLGFRIR